MIIRKNSTLMIIKVEQAEMTMTTMLFSKQKTRTSTSKCHQSTLAKQQKDCNSYTAHKPVFIALQLANKFQITINSNIKYKQTYNIHSINPKGSAKPQTTMQFRREAYTAAEQLILENYTCQLKSVTAQNLDNPFNEGPHC